MNSELALFSADGCGIFPGGKFFLWSGKASCIVEVSAKYRVVVVRVGVTSVTLPIDPGWERMKSGGGPGGGSLQPTDQLIRVTQ